MKKRPATIGTGLEKTITIVFRRGERKNPRHLCRGLNKTKYYFKNFQSTSDASRNEASIKNAQSRSDTRKPDDGVLKRRYV